MSYLFPFLLLYLLEPRRPCPSTGLSTGSTEVLRPPSTPLLLCLPGPASLRAYPLLSVITRQPAVISHLVPAAPGVAQALSRHPATEAACTEAPGENHGSSESETEQPAPRQKKPRRSRTIFTELQLMGLEKKFQKQKYLSTPDR